MLPDDEVQLKCKISLDLTKDCYNSEHYQQCILFAKKTTDLSPDNKEVRERVLLLN